MVVDAVVRLGNSGEGGDVGHWENLLSRLADGGASLHSRWQRREGRLPAVVLMC